jgi:hypothetical protein
MWNADLKDADRNSIPTKNKSLWRRSPIFGSPIVEPDRHVHHPALIVRQAREMVSGWQGCS